MQQELHAGAVTLLQLLKGEKEFISPLFQRRYVWTDTEIDKLWEDIDGIIDGTAGTRFLGALVLEIRVAGLAFQPDSMWIVDGQQRLSTLYMALLRIAIEAERAVATELANTLYRQYLFNQDGISKDRPKLKPTLLDYRQFNALFNEIGLFMPSLDTMYGEDKGQLQKAYRRVKSAVRERIFDEKSFSETRARRVVSAILESLKFVQIVLGASQDAHQVFDRLNSGGIRLETKDLIRNIVFEKKAGSPAEAQSLYTGKWLPFEESLGTRLEDYFFPYGLIQKPTITKSSLLGMLREQWKQLEPDQIVRELQVYVPAFDALTVADIAVLQRITDSSEVIAWLQRLHRMRLPSTLLPFLMKLLRMHQDSAIAESWVARNMAQVESFLVRRAIAGYEPSGLHAVFKDLWNKTSGDPTLFVDEIENNATVQFPDDEQFERDIREKPLYGRKLAAYILGEYERGLRGGDPMPDIDVTIDHVMPKELTDAWKNVITPDDHKALKDTWANLVPLSMPANAEKGRKPWPEVRQYFQTETVFKTTKRLAQQYERWDKETILERAEHLVLWAVDRWPKRA